MLDLTKYQPQWVRISDINVANRMFQFRKDITPESVAELAKSMAEEGLKFPIIRWLRLNGESVPVAGLRRLTAAISLNWESIYSITLPESEVSYEEVLKLNFIENIERKTLNTLDIMFACKKLNDEGKPQLEIAKLIGKSETQVRRYVNVANAPADAQAKLVTGEATIKEVGNEQSAPGGGFGDKDKKYIVKSTKNGIDAKIKIEAVSENEASLNAFIAEVKKAWKKALKSKTRLTGGKATSNTKLADFNGGQADNPASPAGVEEAGKQIPNES